MNGPARILLLAPPSGGPRGGNWVTARRVAAQLRSLGHAVRLRASREPGDALVALHAEKTSALVEKYRRSHPELPIVVILAGTDLYGPRALTRAARRSLALADRLVVLHPGGVLDLPRPVRAKARVILQSAPLIRGRRGRRGPAFEVAVVGHLRRIKDPFRAALAVRGLPPSSRLRVLHLGAEIEPGMAARARAEMRRNPRYRWLGAHPHRETLRRIAASRLLVLSSRHEGGANVISEALAAGVPVIASAHRAALALLGADYPGLYPVGDTEGLRARLLLAESAPRFLARLVRACRRVARRLTPQRERAAWRRLLAELGLDARNVVATESRR